MSNFNVICKRILKEGKKDDIKTEIWADITDLATCKTIKKRIWWKDDKGIMHDGTTDLPTNLRDLVDNAWIESRRSLSRS